MLEIRSPGAFASIQDRGRQGYRHAGVPASGTLAPLLMRIANRLAGNPDDTAIIECFDGGQIFAAVDAPVRLAVAGDAALAVVVPDGREQRLSSWRSLTLERGASVRLRSTGAARIAVVGIFGLQAPTALGSASSYARAGLCGGALAAGDRFAVGAHPAPGERVLPQPPTLSSSDFRVVLGPQQEAFERATIDAFLATTYHVGAASDRMGMRLQGPALKHRRATDHEIVSDAIVPGAIQVPGNGMPIVLLADAQTVGGYPKIATVISADLPRLAILRPGDAVRFAAVDAVDGERIAREAAAREQALLDTIRPLAGEGLDLDALYSVNLVGGAVDALDVAPQDNIKDDHAWNSP